MARFRRSLLAVKGLDHSFVSGAGTMSHDEIEARLMALELSAKFGFASDGTTDKGVPPRPEVEGVSIPQDGTVINSLPAFPALINCAGISRANIRAYYWDELAPETTTLTTAITDLTGVVFNLADASEIQPDSYFYIDSEILQAKTVVGNVVTAYSRGVNLSVKATHANASVVRLLQTVVWTYTFSLGFFVKPTLDAWQKAEPLSVSRLIATETWATNSFGDSAHKHEFFGTGFITNGLRTLYGGRYDLQISGPASVETDAVTPYVLPVTSSVWQIYMQAAVPPTGTTPLTVNLKYDGSVFGTLTLPTSAGFPYISNVLYYDNNWGRSSSFINPPVFQSDKLFQLDVTSVGDTTPGSDISVYIQI